MLSPSPLAHCESGADLLFIVVPWWMATDLKTRKERRIRKESSTMGQNLHFLILWSNPQLECQASVSRGNSTDKGGCCDFG
jgi:hypothetical protein